MAGLRDAALIERDDELSLIDEAIQVVASGSSRVLVLKGPAGIGKTRLLAALRERARAAGLVDLVAHGSPLERSYPFGVARQLFQPALAALDNEQRALLLSGHARAAAHPLALASGTKRSGEDATYAALNGLYWLCVNLAAGCPLAITIDDAHWSDDASLRFLAFAAARIDGIPVLIALSTRPSEPGTDAPALIAQLEELASAEILTLRALTRAAVARLIGPAYGTEPSEAFTVACYQATRGNPLLLHELLIEAHAAGVSATDAGARQVAALGPSRVSASVLARVNRLGHTATRLTHALAILGDRASLTHTATLAGLKEPEAASAAASLSDAGVLAEGFPLAFTHPLVRQAIYEQLPYAQRLTAHTRAAQILQASGARPEAIAAHLLITPPNADPNVVELLRRAAADATTQGSPACAVSYLRRALDEPPPLHLRGELLSELGIAEHNADDAGAVEHLSEALAVAGSPQQRARIGLVLARAIWHTGKIAEAVSLLATLVDSLDAVLGAPREAELIAIARLDPRTRAIGVRRINQRDPDTVQDDEARRLLLANLAFEEAVSARQSSPQVARLANHALADGRLLAQEGSENTIYYLTAWALAQCDRYAEAEHALQAGLALAREEGSVVGFARALTFRSNLCYRRGLLREAHADVEQALDHLTPIRAPLAVAFLLDVLIERDELQAAHDTLKRFGLAGELPDSILHTLVLERRARLHLAQHRPQDALADLLACRQRALQWGAESPAFLPWRSTTALALAQTDHSSEARDLAAGEVERARAFAAPRALGIALRSQGLLAPRTEGLSLLAEAVVALQGSGASLEHARTLIYLGGALRRAGRRGVAREKLRAGLELADQYAATALAAHARSELRSAGGRPLHAPRSGRDSLSPAELRVAAMAVAGMSNRDIAQALFVTPKTVEWHLGQTYRKLGLHSRIQLSSALDARGPEPPIPEPLAPAG